MMLARDSRLQRKHYRAPRPTLPGGVAPTDQGLPGALHPGDRDGRHPGGVYTTTEAALIGRFYVIAIEMLYYKAFSLKDLFGMFVESAKVTGVVILLIATSLMLTYVIVLSKVPLALQDTLVKYVPNGHMALIVITAILLFTGCFLDLTPSLLIFTPVFFPFATKLGVDPIQLGVVMTMVLGIGLFTPPVGQTLYISALVAEAPSKSSAGTSCGFCGDRVRCAAVIFYLPTTLWMAGM